MPEKDKNLTPEEEQKKKRPAEVLAESIKTSGEQSEQAIAAANAEASAARQQAITDTQAAQAQAEQDIADVLIGIGNDARRARQENQVITDLEADKAKWAAVTEAAAALTNLVGVAGFNSSNQQPKQYSQSWMQEADRQRQQREKRIDDIKSNLDRLKERSAALKQGNATALAKMRVDAVAADAAAKEAAAKREADREVSIATALAKQAQTDEAFEQKKELEEMGNKSRERVAAINANARERVATANANARVEAAGVRASGGSGSTIKLTVEEDPNGGPKETFEIKPGSLKETLTSNIYRVSDLSEKDQQQLMNDLIMADTPAKVQLVADKYLAKSKQLRAVVRESSVNRPKAPLKAAANGVTTDKNGFRIQNSGLPAHN